MKQKQKGKIWFVIYIAGFFFNFFFVMKWLRSKRREKSPGIATGSMRYSAMVDMIGQHDVCLSFSGPVVTGFFGWTCVARSGLVTIGWLCDAPTNKPNEKRSLLSFVDTRLPQQTTTGFLIVIHNIWPACLPSVTTGFSCVYICTNIHTDTDRQVCVCVCVCLCSCACACVHVQVCVCMSVCLCVYNRAGIGTSRHNGSALLVSWRHLQ